MGTKAPLFFQDHDYPEQKYLVGLLHSILWTLLSNIPELQMEVLPVFRTLRAINRIPTSEDRTEHELRAALEAIKTQKRFTCHILLFIDALEEYAGQRSRITDFIEGLIDDPSYTSFQLCVSSCADDIFAKRFGRLSRIRRCDIRLHTKKDLAKVARETLERYPRLCKYIARSVFGLEYVATEIAQLSQGIFIWISLVVEELDQTLEYSNHGHGRQLFAKPAIFPLHLNPLYQWIVDSIPPDHRRKVQIMFEIVRCADGGTTLLKLSALTHLALLGQSIPDDKLLKDIELISPEELQRTCRGILILDTCKHTVKFLHHTAKEFFRYPQIWLDLIAEPKSVYTWGYSYLCRGLFVLAKTQSAPSELQSAHGKLRIVGELGGYSTFHPEFLVAQTLDNDKPEILVSILEQLEQVPWVHITVRLLLAEYPIIPGTPGVELLAAKYGWPNALRRRIEDGYRCPEQASGTCSPLFVSLSTLPLSNKVNATAEIVELLLKAGADANEAFRGENGFLGRALTGTTLLRTRWTADDLTIRRRAWKIVRLLILHGADPDSNLFVKDNDTSQMEIFTPLHLAITQLNFTMVEFLFESAAYEGLYSGLDWVLQNFTGARSETNMIDCLLQRGTKLGYTAQLHLGRLLNDFRDSVKPDWLRLKYHIHLPDEILAAVEQRESMDGHRDGPVSVYCQSEYLSNN